MTLTEVLVRATRLLIEYPPLATLVLLYPLVILYAYLSARAYEELFSSGRVLRPVFFEDYLANTSTILIVYLTALVNVVEPILFIKGLLFQDIMLVKLLMALAVFITVRPAVPEKSLKVSLFLALYTAMPLTGGLYLYRVYPVSLFLAPMAIVAHVAAKRLSAK